MVNLKDVQKKVASLGYKCHGLIGPDGTYIEKPNGSARPDKLPGIITKLEHLPPGKYVILGTTGTRGGGSYRFDVDTSLDNTEFPKNGNSLAGHQQLDIDPVEYGRLLAENASLKNEILDLVERVQDLEDELNQDAEDVELAAAPPSAQQLALEAVMPLLPALGDRALSLLDNYLNKTKPQPQSSELSQDQIQAIAAAVQARIYADVQAQQEQAQNVS